MSSDQWARKIEYQVNENLLAEFWWTPSYNWHTGFKNMSNIFVNIANNVMLWFESMYLCKLSFLAIYDPLKLRTKLQN